MKKPYLVPIIAAFSAFDDPIVMSGIDNVREDDW